MREKPVKYHPEDTLKASLAEAEKYNRVMVIGIMHNEETGEDRFSIRCSHNDSSVLLFDLNHARHFIETFAYKDAHASAELAAVVEERGEIKLNG